MTKIKPCCDIENETIGDKQSNNRVLLVGNPNTGKSLIFNLLTGYSVKVANFSGVTFQAKSGRFIENGHSHMVYDLPGFYGFSDDTAESASSKRVIYESEDPLIVNVIDINHLDRNLLLTKELLLLNKRMILVLNFVDTVHYDVNALTSRLRSLYNIPVLGVSAIKERGIRGLKQTIIGEFETLEAHTKDDKLMRPSKVAERIEQVAAKLNDEKELRFSEVFLSMLDEEYLKDYSPFANDKFMKVEKEVFKGLNIPVKVKLIDTLYEEIQSDLSGLGLIEDNESKLLFLDRFLLNQYVGLIIFSVLIWLSFKITFDLGGIFTIWIDAGVRILGDVIKASLPNALIASFLVDGLLAGIGFILIFLPQVTILFLIIGIMEQSGYLTRVVYITDRFLTRAGVSGKSIAPLLLGFGCNVPAILSTRIIPDSNEKKVTALSIPFVSCSARFPILVLFGSMVSTAYPDLIVAGAYLLSIAVAVTTIFLLRKFFFRGKQSLMIMELPNLQFPLNNTLFNQVYAQVKDFIKGIGKGVGIGVVILWLLSITSFRGLIGPAALHDPILFKQSLAYSLGQYIQFVFYPMGWDVRIIVALLFGFITKELFIGALGILYGTNLAILSQQFTPVSALSLMLFVLLYVPCLGTVFALKQEVGTRWTLFSMVYSLTLAWVVAFVVYSFGGLILFG